MPKKLGINPKALESRERKQATKKATQEQKAKEAEDKLWQDNDKSLQKKQQRRDEEERKRLEAAKRKEERKTLLDEEMSTIKTEQKSKQPLAKINQAKIVEELEKKQRAIDAINAAKQPAGRVVVQNDYIEENLNRVMADTDIATNIDEALVVLKVKDDAEDRHPEKRMRAAFKTFETNNLPRIKAENPTLRMSQWKQMLMKEWNKSPENPFNQKQ